MLVFQHMTYAAAIKAEINLLLARILLDTCAVRYTTASVQVTSTGLLKLHIGASLQWKGMSVHGCKVH